MSRNLAISLAALGAFTLSVASAAPVTPDVIFGTGNANGSFTINNVQSNTEVELGLRGKLRYNSAGQPENTFNWDGVDTYTFDLAGNAVPAARSVFNFEWSINSDSDDGSETLDSYLYLLSVDFDAGAGTSFISYDPLAENLSTGAYFGTNATGNGGAAFTSPFSPSMTSLQATNNVAQNSVNYGFLPGAPLTAGTYVVMLSAFADQADLLANNALASTSITINVNPVPLPAALPLFGAGLVAFSALRRRRKQAG